MHYFIAKNNEWTPFLKKELAEYFPESKIKSYSKLPLLSIKSSFSLKNLNLGLSLTSLPNTKTLSAESISNQSKSIIELIIKTLDPETPFTLQVFSVTEKYGVITTGRAEILRDNLMKKLRQNKYFQKNSLPLHEKNLIQILINKDRSTTLSLVQKKEMAELGQLLSPFPGGFTTVKEMKIAPSRAYRKIVEAQKVLGASMKEDQLVVDLGACPGGWSFIARQNGSRVIALDRSELRQDLMDDPKVTFISSDAFKYVSPEAVDWVISDIICSPERIFELLENWVVSGHCQNFVFTIKFQGPDNYSILKKFHEMINTLSHYRCILRQLNTNKNEVTIMGSRK